MSSKTLDKLNLICYDGSIEETMGKIKYPTEHDKTQYMALKWLEGFGYKCSLETNVKINTMEYRVDVYGEKDNNKIIIECGYSEPGKLRHLKEFTTNLYIWPIGSKEPIIWDGNFDICKTCGQIRPTVEFDKFDMDEFIKLKIPDKLKIIGGYLSYEDIPKRTIIKKVRMDEIVKMRQNGLTYEQIGNILGISRERVRQLLPVNIRGNLSKPRKRINLREMGEKLKNNQAIKITAKNLIGLRQLLNKWYSLFPGRARTRRIKKDGTYTLYLWLEEV